MTVSGRIPHAATAERHVSIDAMLDGMRVEDLVGQLMCVYLTAPQASTLLEQLKEIGLKPGGVLLAGPRTVAQAREDVAQLTRSSAISLLIAANLESGTSTFLTDGEVFANPMQVAATGSVLHATRLGQFCAARGREVGVNWAFAPVIDVALNHRNPITGTRTFGMDPARIAEYAAAYISAVQAGGVAASAKHWPGDGVDDRDQHLVTSVNSLPIDAWMQTYGAVYRSAIEAGVMTVMAAHIALPAYFDGGDRADAYVPASLNRRLITDLLRGALGFDGLVVSDNNLMAGFTRVMPRNIALPTAINAGCDMLLGSQFVPDDYTILLQAVADGRISEGRLREAVGRVLQVKARLGLLAQPDTDVETQRHAPLPERASDSDFGFDRWKRDVAAQSITLAKHTDDVLPVTSARYRRVLVYVLGDTGTFYDPAANLAAPFIAGLQARGLIVERRDVPAAGRSQTTERDIQQQHDLVIYFANHTFTSDSNTSRIVWSYPQGPEAPRRPDVPVLLASIADPYHLQDMPSVGTAVNAYSPSLHTIDAVLACITGEEPFRGVSPIDPFCGYPDAHLS
jgi:beta-N-acetylhexosaminidase